MKTTGIASGYGIVQTDVFRIKGLSIQAKAIYSYLASMTGSKDYCFPKQKTIAEAFGISERYVRTIINQLIEYNLIKKSKLYNDIRTNLKYEVLYISRGEEAIDTIEQNYSSPTTRTTVPLYNNNSINNNRNNMTMSNRDTRVIAQSEDKSSSIAIHSSNKKFSSKTNKGEREKSGIEKSLVDNFTDEQMLSFSKEKRIPVATLSSFKEKYILWIQSNPKKNKCWNRNMSATVKTWINNAISKGEIIPAPKPLTQKEVIEKQRRELIMMWGSEEQKKKYEDKQ
jgi:DNA-binding MarR family transcriptional regulator